jgi:hypothetical protein
MGQEADYADWRYIWILSHTIMILLGTLFLSAKSMHTVLATGVSEGIGGSLVATGVAGISLFLYVASSDIEDFGCEPVQSLGVLHSAKAKAANDFLRIQVCRHYLDIQLETVRSWDRRKSIVVEISEKAFLRGYFAPFNSIWIADSACRLFPRAMQEHRKQFTFASLHDFFEFLVLRKVVWLSVAEGCDDKRNAVLCGCVNGRAPDAMYQFPESRSAEVEDRTR